MSKNVTTYDCDFITRKKHSKTTSRHINDFFGGEEIVEKIDKVFQTDLDVIGKFLEAYHK